MLEDHEGVATCATTAEAKAGKLGVLLIEPSGTDPVGGRATQLGLVPDEVKAARAASAGGDAFAVGIGSRGAYAVSSGRPIRELRLQRAGRSDLVLKGRVSPRSRSLTASPLARTANYAVFCHNTSQFCTISSNIWTAVYPIYDITINSFDNWLCANAVNGDGSWAGTTFCTNTYGGASHPYNGSNRTGWGGPGVAGVPVYGRGIVSF